MEQVRVSISRYYLTLVHFGCVSTLCLLYSFYVRISAYIQVFLNAGIPAKKRQLTHLPLPVDEFSQDQPYRLLPREGMAFDCPTGCGGPQCLVSMTLRQKCLLFLAGPQQRGVAVHSGTESELLSVVQTGYNGSIASVFIRRLVLLCVGASV